MALGLLVGTGTACSRPSPAALESEKKATPGVRVEVAPVRAGVLPKVWTVVGDVTADARASLASGANGAVDAVEVEVGDRVKKGALLAEVDPRLPRARLAVARAEVQRAERSLALAKVELDRIDDLDPGIVPPIDLDRAKSQVDTAEAVLASTRAAQLEALTLLELHRVVAPFDGVVAARQADPGDWVESGDPLLELVSIETVDVLVELPELVLTEVAVGFRAETAAGDLRVAGIVPALDPVERTARVRLVPATPEVAAQLRPGSAIDVAFEVPVEAEAAVLVSSDALLQSPSETRLVRVRDGKAEILVIRVVARTHTEALVEAEGLSVGDRVVVRGNERLKPDAPLLIED